MDRRALGTLSFGHLATDACQGAVPALLPFLIAWRGFSLTQASLLVLAATIASSVLQPVFGVMSDRRSLPLLMPLGPLLAAAGIAAVGFCSSFAEIFGVIVISGIGVAAFHPEASRYANYVSTSRPALGMSMFSVGGNTGVALGPALVAAVVVPFGLRGTLSFIAPAILASSVIALQLPRLRALRPRKRVGRATVATDHWAPFVRLAVAVVLRSGVYFGLLTFVPLWFTRHLHTSKAAGDTALTVMLAAGALGTLVGGRLADRFGPRTVFIASMCCVPPIVAAFLSTGSPLLAGALLAAAGATTIATFSTTVVIGQQLLPNHLGIASGVMLGLSIGAGGVMAAGLGLIAQAEGLMTVLAIVALLPLPAVALASSMPRAGTRHAGRPAEPLAAATTPQA